MKTIFVTYNSDSAVEQTLAIRLHTIGATNGFKMYLPDRSNSESALDEETKSRIRRSDYVIMFSTENLSPVVRKEIEFASSCLHDKSRIIVIYDKKKGKNLRGDIVNNFTPIFINDKAQSDALTEIINTIHRKEHHTKIKELEARNRQLEVEKSNSNALAALLGIGLGLFILASKPEK